MVSANLAPTPHQEDKPQGNKAISLDLTEDDWGKFLGGAKQLRYKKGDNVLQEGSLWSRPCLALQGTGPSGL